MSDKTKGKLLGFALVILSAIIAGIVVLPVLWLSLPYECPLGGCQ